MELSWRKTPREQGSEAPSLSAMDRPIERKLWTRPRVIAAACALLLIVAGIFGYVRYGVARTAAVSRERVVVATVERGEFLEYIPLIGVIEPRETVYLDAVDGGQVTEILAEEGALITAGQPLVRLSNAHLQLQLINSEAQLMEQLDRLTATKLQFQQSGLAHTRDLIDAKFRTEQAQQRLARLVALSDSGIVKRAELEDEQLEVERLKRIESEVARAKEQHESLRGQEIRQLDQSVASLNRYLQVARQNLSRLVIAAPFDGQLTMLDAHVGESKQPGQRIGQVDRVDTFKVTAMIDEHYLPRVTIDQIATAQVDGRSRSFELAKIYPEVRGRQFKVDFTVPPDIARSLRRGQSLQLRLQLGGASASVVVANGAFYDDSGGAWAFVLPPQGATAQRRAVTLGRRNPEQVEVINGLSPGERVIVSSYESFQDAERVELTGGER